MLARPTLGLRSAAKAVVRLAACAVCVAALTGCAGEGLGVAEDARKGGSLTLALDRPPGSLDPALATGPQAWLLAWQAYTGPLTLRRVPGQEGTEVAPGLARRLPQISDGGRTWTLELRPGLRYSDGSPLRATDLVHSLRRVRALGSPGKRLFAGVRSVEADDRLGQVTYRLRAANGAFAQVLASTYAAPVPARVPLIDQGGRPPPGIGPYRLVTERGQLLLVRRRGFRLPEVAGANVDRIAVSVEPDPERRARRTISGDLDVTVGPLPPQRLPDVRSKYAKRYDESAGLRSTMFALSSRSPPFDDVRVRQAVNFAVDSEAFGRVLDGRLAPGCTVLAPKVSGYREPDPCPYGDPAEPGDLRRAATLLREADAEGARVTVGGPPGASDRAVVRSFARLLRKLGLRARVVRPGARAQATLLRLRPTVPDPQAYLRPLRRLDPQLAEAARRVRADADPERAAEDWATLDSDLVERARVVPLGYDEDATLLSARIDSANCFRAHPMFGADLSSFCLE
ncbi:MAG: ABC transporter substrate-binding protein [Actinomycetota bacterium]|nr:ABC transporter substrate-binding protein [Actinomycetota bacterium]